MSIRLKGSVLRFQLTRSRLAATRVRPWLQLPKYMIILGFLFRAIGVPHCPICGNEVTRRTTEVIIDEILRQFVDKRILLLAPIVKNKKGEFAHIPEQYQRLGYARVRVDGVVYALDEFPELQKVTSIISSWWLIG